MDEGKLKLAVARSGIFHSGFRLHSRVCSAVLDHYLHMNGCSTVPLYQGKSARKYSCGISNIPRSGRSICSISIQLRSPRPSPKSIRDTLVVCWCGNRVELESAHILRDFICMGQCNYSNFNYSDLRLPSDDTKT